MRTTIRIGLGAAALAVALSSCGVDDRTAVEKTFRDYHAALLARDFPAACSLKAPEDVERLLQTVKSQTGQTVTTCTDGLKTVFDIPGAADIADGIASTVQIDKITVDGDKASVTWNAEVDGEHPTVTNAMRRIEGQWRMLENTA